MTQESPYIVIVDDDQDDREFLCAGMLRSVPHVSMVALTNGNDLLAYLQECPAMNHPAVIFLDYSMPGLTGADLLRIIGKGTRYATIPKIICSTSPLKKEIDECQSLGALRWIVKPNTDGELDLIIQTLKPLFMPTAIPRPV